MRTKLALLVIISCIMLPITSIAASEHSFYVDLKYAGPYGKGKADNEFVMGTGHNIGYQYFEAG